MAGLIKERCSALGHLMVGAELGGSLIPLGVTDQKRLDQCLQAKENSKLTPAMERDLALLIEKRDTPFNPELSVGAKTHVQNKWYGQKFDYQKRFSNKYTRKGNEREAQAIKQAGEYLGYPFTYKNEKHLENDYIHGTYDFIKPIFIGDTKCVWEPSGLGFFSKEIQSIYEWQGKGYCYLGERDHFALIRILMNPPETMIYSLAKPLWEEAGYHWSEQITDEFLEDVKHEYDFEAKNPIEDRIRLLRVDFTERDQLLINQQVNLMNEYWQTLDEDFANRNKLEYEFFKRKT
jgi:hypothetical protein